MRTDELIEYAQSGISEALTLIVERYHHMVIKISNQFFGSWAEKSDIIQNGYVGLLKAIYYYKTEREANFTTFAWTNINSEIKSFLTYLNRKKNKILSDSLSYDFAYNNDSDDEDASYYIKGIKDTYEQTYDNEILFEKTLFVLKAEISDNEYAVFDNYLKNYSYAEISSLLDIKIKKVDNTIQKCRKKFKKIYGEESDLLKIVDEWLRRG